jgi:hypothetical protein
MTPRYKLRYDIRFQPLGEEYIGVAVGADATRFQGMLRLNETGVRIAQLLAEPRTVIELAEMLAEEYDEQQSVLCNIVNDTIASLGGIVEETQDTEA